MTLQQAIKCLDGDGVVLYPTETFYALGGLAESEKAVNAIYSLKTRPVNKPLPLLAGDVRQAREVAYLESCPAKLIENFWPGPLSILLRPKKHFPACLMSPGGLIALRVTSHRLAGELAKKAGVMTCSSANQSGMPASANLAEISKQLMENLNAHKNFCGIVDAQQKPAGILPSTLVEPVLQNGLVFLNVHRAGAVSMDELRSAGFRIMQKIPDRGEI